MFRKLVRIKQQIPEEECIEILKAAPRGVLSVIGDDGYPYGMPLNHYYCEDDGKIYFHSGKTGHKVDAILRDPKASFCVCDQGVHEDGDWALTFRSVIVFGKIEIVEGYDRIIEISRALSHKFTQDEAYIAHEIEHAGKRTLCFALVPEQICGKRVHEK